MKDCWPQGKTHEFSHTLGLPDIYPTNGITEHNQSPEYWDVMDMGNYQADGYQPIPYSPWEKSIVGWKQPTLLSDTEAKQIKLEPYDKASDAYKIIANSQGEYLLLQNIRNEGWYKEAPGYGLLVVWLSISWLLTAVSTQPVLRRW